MNPENFNFDPPLESKNSVAQSGAWTPTQRQERLARIHEEATRSPDRARELEREQKILSYLDENLPEGEERIANPMASQCEVAIVIPAYSERGSILRTLESLSKQQETGSEQFEVIVVVNNPESARQEIQDDNQETIRLIRNLGGDQIPTDVSPEELKAISSIRDYGLRIYVIDKASPGKNLSPEESNVGGARNRGVAEAVARFYE